MIARHSNLLVTILTAIVLGFFALTAITGVAHAAGTTVDTGGGAGTQGTGGGNGTSNTGGGNGTQDTGGGAQTDGAIPVLQNPLNHINSLPELLHAILQAVVELGSILLVVMLVWVGFLFVMAQGNPEGISKARSALIWTLIGGLILLGAEAISLVVQATVSQL